MHTRKTRNTTLKQLPNWALVLPLLIACLCPIQGLIAQQKTSVTCGSLLYTKESTGGEYGFVGQPTTSRRAKLIPNLEQREKRGMKSISGINGAVHFFLDHDLTTGFVHPYTKVFFNRLQPEDFVLKFTRDEPGSEVGSISYMYKKDLLPSDKLGQNIALFRQWKLSEFQLRQVDETPMIVLKTCGFSSFCGCPQALVDGVVQEVPIWTQTYKRGVVPLASLNALGRYSGGTVVLIYELQIDGISLIVFQDIHGSLEQIITKAQEIARQNQVDPVIALSDAGPFARKVKADQDGNLDCAALKAIAPRGKYFGAGFGYLLKQEIPSSE